MITPKGKTLFLTRPEQYWGIIGQTQASLLRRWHGRGRFFYNIKWTLLQSILVCVVCGKLQQVELPPINFLHHLSIQLSFNWTVHQNDGISHVSFLSICATIQFYRQAQDTSSIKLCSLATSNRSANSSWLYFTCNNARKWWKLTWFAWNSFQKRNVDGLHVGKYFQLRARISHFTKIKCSLLTARWSPEMSKTSSGKSKCLVTEYLDTWKLKCNVYKWWHNRHIALIIIYISYTY